MLSHPPAMLVREVLLGLVKCSCVATSVDKGARMAEPLTKQTTVLLHAVECGTTTIAGTAAATGLTVNEARAMLLALERKGLVFERLESAGDQPAQRGRYAVTPAGRWQTRRFRVFDETSKYEVGEA